MTFDELQDQTIKFVNLLIKILKHNKLDSTDFENLLDEIDLNKRKSGLASKLDLGITSLYTQEYIEFIENVHSKLLNFYQGVVNDNAMET